MAKFLEFIRHHGLPLVFAAVFLEQIGLPLPALPWLLAAGALAAEGAFALALAILITMLACLLADTMWFYLGRYRGNQVVRLLCRISLEPDSCVRRTQNVFTKYGLKGLLIAKFVPGLNTVAPPLAGMSRVSVRRFLMFDAGGAILYGGSFILLGFIFHDQLEQIAGGLASIGGKAFVLMVGLVGAYIGYKFWQRQRLLRELHMAKITVEELRQKQEAGDQILILDLRSNASVEEDPLLIVGAIHLTPDDIEKRQGEIPRDREIVVYCACPNEVTSARVALMLRKKGFTRVRPLLGGIDAWREQKLPMEKQKVADAGVEKTGVAVS
jgi:membrane protein DedA with SNARE-associated domain/rhodanese-related sulfurtransferase